MADIIVLTKKKKVLAIPIKNLCSLLGIEDEARVVSSEHSYDTQTQAGGVTAHQTGRLEQQLGLHQTQLVQELPIKHKQNTGSHDTPAIPADWALKC